MPTVKFIHFDGRAQNVEVDPGSTLMEGARGIGVDGIDGECGGNLSCATCHVYVDEEWFGKLPPVGDIENELLDATASPRRAESRLSCQISMNEALDGLRVFIPETQY
jgi:ferredoxin, 2Fe-2S